MGSASSKFKKHLHHGDEFAAMQVYQGSPELRKSLDPNVSYGDGHQHNTALHYAARHGMKHLLRTFLNDHGGNPNKKNGANETALHAACAAAVAKTFSAQDRRAACVTLILQWRGVALNTTGLRERIDLAAQDQHGNTALHCATEAGLRRCVELLVAHGASLFLENHDKLTPCDLAARAAHLDIAQLLESKMVFDDTSDTVNEASLYGNDEQEEVYSGLRTQDLQEAKDQLLVETSDMLHIPLFTADALLRDNEWSRESLLEKWMKDPVQCCQLAGVQPPPSALLGAQADTAQLETAHRDAAQGDPAQDEVTCDICLRSLPPWSVPAVMSCLHRFCAACWEGYLTVRIQEGDAHHILCPAFACHYLVPVEVIERLVSPEIARRYLQFDIKAFVESNRSIKWCPMPGCGRAVRLPETEQVGPVTPRTSHAVDCGNSHFFCWECLGEAHAPSGCDQWGLWQRKISEVKPEELRASGTETEDAANCLWLVTNSKPCPNCRSPIQKNEGCNHMKCSKCKYDFCWVCLESWKKHSSATGGYFRCNRFEAMHKADEKQGSLITEAVERNVQLQELNRFLHFYTRFRNHQNSQKLEEPLLDGVRKKMDVLASALARETRQPGQAASDVRTAAIRFVEDGVRELLKARRALCGSYVYGFYLDDDGYNKAIFEFMQHELEEVTEKLSEMVARPYLRTPRSVIIQTTALARRKRHEFVRAVGKGLVPPETPPSVRRLRKRRFPAPVYPGDDEQMSHAIAASLKDLDPSSGPWVKDSRGRHTNLAALCDWPDEDEEPEAGPEADPVRSGAPCARPGCERRKAGAARNGAAGEYCGLRCARMARIADDGVYRVNVSADYNMELVIALEMSRLQMIEDEMKKSQRAAKATGEPGTSVAGTGVDEQQMKMAIQLSLQETTKLAGKLHDAAAANGDGGAEPPGEELYANAAMFSRTSADLTVDYFLKSLAGRQIELNVFAPETGGTAWGCGAAKTLDDKTLFQPRLAEDGRFRISDLHDSGCYFDADDFDDARLLKRSHSTGDLCVRGRRPRHGTSSENEPRYRLDSDHSAHDERPEELVLRLLASRARYFPSPPSVPPDTSTATSSLGGFGQSSVEDATTASDSLNADLEVCGILAVADEGSSAAAATAPGAAAPDPKAVALTLLEAHRKAFKAAGGKAAGNSGLRIRISPDGGGKSGNGSGRGRVPGLETDSSNEYEAETGIPRSPTLFISGVSISRTPEPRSPALAAPARDSRSSSLTVPPALAQAPAVEGESSRQKDAPAEPPSPAKSKSASEPEREREMFRFPKSSTDGALSSVLHVQESNLSSDDFHEALFLLERSPKGGGSGGGPGPSGPPPGHAPPPAASKRRKKSKKERDKDKENSAAVGGAAAKAKEPKEASSAL